ncbi:MAG: hypothetical protein M1840_005441 [Geoglossum simile]|nr:MAG: hypothetical protein M1840_005441 [Geoglossum simile]
MNFVRSLRDIMGAEAEHNGSRGQMQAHYGGQSPTVSAPTRSGGCCGNRSDGSPLRETAQPCGALYNTTTGLPPHPDAWPSLPSPKGSSAATAALRSPASQHPWLKFGEADIENEGEEAISPTAYFHVDYPIGVCTEENGCLCGEGCTCVGCLTHGGHDGVKLAPFTTDLDGGLVTNDTGGQTTRENDTAKQFDNNNEGEVPFSFVPSAMNRSGF